jgi:hypothetical protein
MSTEKYPPISNKTFFDTDHDNNFQIESNEPEELTPDDVLEEEEVEVEEQPEDILPGDPEEEEDEDEEELDVIEQPDADDEETEESEEEDEITEFSFSPLVGDLIDEGVLDIEDIENYEDSPEGFRQAVTDTVNKKFEGLIKSLSPKAQRLIEIEQAGGEEAFEALLDLESVDYNEIDLDDEDNQKLLIKNKLTVEGYTSEEIEERLQDLEDLNKLDKEAKIAHRYLSAKAEKEKEALVEQVKKDQKAREDSNAKSVEEFRDKVLGTAKVGGFEISKADRAKLYDYITKPVVKEKGTGRAMTQMEVDSTFENKLKQAYLQMKGYDYSSIEKKAATKVNLKVKKTLAHYKDNNQKGNTSQKPREQKVSTKIPNYWEGDRNNVL